MKYFIALALVAILAALALAGVFMMRDGRDGKPKTGNMMRALALRVALSVLLFAFILFSYWAGWIQPTGIPLGR
ncbi:MAG: twin transmembrane helix small protein [Burkholderiaceae bacterium]